MISKSLKKSLRNNRSRRDSNPQPRPKSHQVASSRIPQAVLDAALAFHSPSGAISKINDLLDPFQCTEIISDRLDFASFMIPPIDHMLKRIGLCRNGLSVNASASSSDSFSI
jgi:hypothetical protein